MLLADPTVKPRLSQAFAETYDTQSDATPWELFQQYQRVLEYSAENPDAGRVAISNAVFDGEVPPSRIRSWINGGMPDAMRGIQTCESHGWLDLRWDGPTLHNLSVAVAWVFSGGSITSTKTPQLAVAHETDSLPTRLLNELGVRTRTVRENETRRATEVLPKEAAAPLGRLLIALGAPEGGKNSLTDLSLPPWISDAPRSVQLAFARTYVHNRGTIRGTASNTFIQIAEERHGSYQRELASFFDTLADEEITHINDYSVHITEPDSGFFVHSTSDAAQIIRGQE